jgi:hypothetical protein
MERAAEVDMALISKMRTYERYGWMILSSSAILGMIAALMTTLPPISWFWDPLFESAYSIMGAWGTTWVAFNILALVMTLVPYRRYERWAWFTLWMLPLLWVSQFVFSPDLSYLVLAALTTIGLILPHRRFFSSVEEGVA